MLDRLALLNFIEPCVRMLGFLIGVLNACIKEEKSTGSVVSLHKDPDSEAKLGAEDAEAPSAPTDEDALPFDLERQHSVTSSSLSIRLLDGSSGTSGVGGINGASGACGAYGVDDVDKADYHRFLSLSNDHTIVIVNDSDSYSIRADAVSNIYCVLNSIMLFLQTAISRRKCPCPSSS